MCGIHGLIILRFSLTVKVQYKVNEVGSRGGVATYCGDQIRHVYEQLCSRNRKRRKLTAVAIFTVNFYFLSNIFRNTWVLQIGNFTRIFIFPSFSCKPRNIQSRDTFRPIASE